MIQGKSNIKLIHILLFFLQSNAVPFLAISQVCILQVARDQIQLFMNTQEFFSNSPEIHQILFLKYLNDFYVQKLY